LAPGLWHVVVRLRDARGHDLIEPDRRAIHKRPPLQIRTNPYRRIWFDDLPPPALWIMAGRGGRLAALARGAKHERLGLITPHAIQADQAISEPMTPRVPMRGNYRLEGR